MYLAFVAYRTRATGNSWLEGFVTRTVEGGVSTMTLLEDILRERAADLGVPFDDIVAVSFNVLPAIVGGEMPA